LLDQVLFGELAKRSIFICHQVRSNLKDEPAQVR
jgi:hypothetical protein